MASIWTEYQDGTGDPTSPPVDADVIVPSNTVNLDQVTRAIYVGVVGDVRVLMLGGTDVTFTNMAAGIMHPMRVVRVYVTGTTATGLVGVY